MAMIASIDGAVVLVPHSTHKGFFDLLRAGSYIWAIDPSRVEIAEAFSTAHEKLSRRDRALGMDDEKSLTEPIHWPLL